jgi:regulator of RNase E activity RraA
VTAVGRPVELEGGVVEPDAFAAADASGAIFLPAARAEEVLRVAADLRANEEQRLRAVRGGADPRSVFAPGDRMSTS